MRSRGLGLLLGLCAFVALSPVVPWALAATFEGVDDRWLGSLSGFAVSVPIALGAAAVVLAVHGLLLQQAMADRLDNEFAAHPGHGFAAASPGPGLEPVQPTVNGSDRTMVGVAATTPAPAGAATVDTQVAQPETEQLGGRMAVRERPPGFGAPQSQKTTGDKVKRVGRRYGHRATGAMRRLFRDSI